MAKPPTGGGKFSPAKLKQAFVTDLAAAWSAARAREPDQTPYGFVLYGVEGESAWLAPHVLTEEGLTDVAQRYVDDGYYDTIGEARDGLRWSVADSPAVQRGPEPELPNVEALFAPHAAALGEADGYRVLVKAVTDALKVLDEQGLFGTGPARGNLLLVIMAEDAERDLSKPTAKKLNPPAAFKRFEDQTRIEGSYKSNNAIVVARDGVRVYAAGGRHAPLEQRGGADVNEIVAFDLRGRRLERRWAFEFPTKGDSVRAMAATADGRALFAVRGRYRNGNDTEALVMRFGPDSHVSVAQHAVGGAEPADLTITPDGSRCAVSIHRDRLVVLDGDLRPIRDLRLPARPRALHFIGPRDLLVAAERAILRLDPEGDAAPQAFDVPARRFSADDAGTLLAVSAGLGATPAAIAKPQPFPVHLLELPTLKMIRTFAVPGHACISVALSPDGTRIAFEAHEVGKVRRFAVAFDVASGNEIGRRRTEYLGDLAFLRDNRTLAIGTNGITKWEAIELWPLPGA